MKDVTSIFNKIKKGVDSNGIKEKVFDINEKVKVCSMVKSIQKGISKISLGDKSILAFSKTCTKKYIELNETVTVTIQLQSRYETGVLDCIVTDEIPPQFELIGDMPEMIYQLDPHEEKEYQYKIKAKVGGHFSMRAICEIENKFSLEDILSNDIEIYVSPLSIQMKTVEMIQEQWKEVDFIFKNISKETIKCMTVSLKRNSNFALEKTQTCNNQITPNQNIVVSLGLKTQESGSVNIDLDVTCVDEHGNKYHTEKNFLVSVIEVDKTTTKVDIGSIGELVASGATQVKDSVIQRSTIGAADTSGTINPSMGGGCVKVNDSVVQRSEIGGGSSVNNVEKKCACNNTLKEEWKMCPFCGIELELNCHKCNQKVEAGWKMCPFCGEKLK